MRALETVRGLRFERGGVYSNSAAAAQWPLAAKVPDDLSALIAAVMRCRPTDVVQFIHDWAVSAKAASQRTSPMAPVAVAGPSTSASAPLRPAEAQPSTLSFFQLPEANTDLPIPVTTSPPAPPAFSPALRTGPTGRPPSLRCPYIIPAADTGKRAAPPRPAATSAHSQTEGTCTDAAVQTDPVEPALHHRLSRDDHAVALKTVSSWVRMAGSPGDSSPPVASPTGTDASFPGFGAWAQLRKRDLPKLFPPPSGLYRLCESDDAEDSRRRSSVDPTGKAMAGKGNYGAVYRGQRASDGRPVAVKITAVKDQWALDEAAALQHCSRIMETATDPGARHIVRLEGPCAFDPRAKSLWLPLPWLPHTLDGLIKHRERLALDPGEPLFAIEEVRCVFRALLQAVRFLSDAAGMVHLDIKPANILLAVADVGHSDDEDRDWGYDDVRLDGTGRSAEVVLCDFGLAQKIGGPLVQLGDFFYMAPEVYWCDIGTGACAKPSDDESPDKHVFLGVSDVWSIGCVVLELLDGHCAYTWEAKEAFEAMRDNYFSLSPRHPTQWPADLLHAMALCLERDPLRRPQAAQLLSHPFLDSALQT